MFIFDRCRRSSAAVAPVKYKCASNNLRGTFARSKILLTEKLTNSALVTPAPNCPSMTLPQFNFSYFPMHLHDIKNLYSEIRFEIFNGFQGFDWKYFSIDSGNHNGLVLISDQPPTVLLVTTWHDGARHLWGWFNIKMPSHQYRKSHCGD